MSDEWQFFLFKHNIDELEHDAPYKGGSADVGRGGAPFAGARGWDPGRWLPDKARARCVPAQGACPGAESTIHDMDVPLEVIWERLAARNQSAGENAVFYVGREELDEWAGLFEVPTEEELT